jgi:hypothetical protein
MASIVLRVELKMTDDNTERGKEEVNMVQRRADVAL